MVLASPARARLALGVVLVQRHFDGVPAALDSFDLRKLTTVTLARVILATTINAFGFIYIYVYDC